MSKFKYSPAPRSGTCAPNFGPTYPEPLHSRSQRSKHRWSSNFLRAPTIVWGERWDSFSRRGRSAQKNAWFWLSLWDRTLIHSRFEFTSAEASRNLGFLIGKCTVLKRTFAQGACWSSKKFPRASRGDSFTRQVFVVPKYIFPPGGIASSSFVGEKKIYYCNMFCTSSVHVLMSYHSSTSFCCP